MHAITRTLATKQLARRMLFAGSTRRLARQQSTFKAPALGVNPAYDEALKVIEAYSTQKASEAEAAHSELQRAEGAGADAATLAALRQKWFDLRVESRINDSSVL
ncbi:hypothetical protein GGF43_001527, partial [Coemansia sp. RSA 2618]